MEQGPSRDFTITDSPSTYNEFPLASTESTGNTLFLSLPSDKSNKFQEQGGAEHSKFRKGILFSTIRAFQLDSMNLFKPLKIPGYHRGASIGAGGREESKEADLKRVPHPILLETGYLKKNTANVLV